MIPARQWLPVSLLIALLGGYGILAVQAEVDQRLADYRVEEEFLYLSSGDWVKRLALGYDGLLACVYWTRAVQHFGRQRLAEGEYKVLYPLLDITTTLDPQLLLAYRFGAIFLAEEPPSGPGEADHAVQLLQKGIRNNPDYWRFWYDLGFLYYRTLKDYEKAAEAFRTGAQHPQALPWMGVMATKVAAEGASRDTARVLWREMHNSTDDPIIRNAAEAHLAGLQVDDQIDILRALLQRYEEATEQRAESFEQLYEEGWTNGVPLDPAGYPYRIGPDGRVLIHPETPIITSQLGERE
jgi:tetratricopeptide (TPR) repeat protein